MGHLEELMLNCVVGIWVWVGFLLCSWEEKFPEKDSRFIDRTQSELAFCCVAGKKSFWRKMVVL